MARRPDDRDELLADLAASLRVPAERIAATDAWRSFPDRGDSLDLVELIAALEGEFDVPRDR